MFSISCQGHWAAIAAVVHCQSRQKSGGLASAERRLTASTAVLLRPEPAEERRACFLSESCPAGAVGPLPQTANGHAGLGWILSLLAQPAPRPGMYGWYQERSFTAATPAVP